MRNPGPLLAPDDPRHGTTTAYVYNRCRCDLCSEARASHARDRGENVRTGRRGEQKRASDRRRRAAKRGEVLPLNVSPYDLLMWAAEGA